jgi:uncharacterized phage protein gp47/JayE
MAFTRPTLTELVDRITQDFVSRLSLVAPILRRSMVYVLARVVAGAAHLLHGHLEFLSRQVFPDLSEGDYLVRQAALFGLARKEAQFASGPVSLTGTDGSAVPLGSILLRSDGAQFETVEDATIAAGVATVTVMAVLAGSAGNCGAGVVLTFESPVAGVSSTAAVASATISNGSEEETDALLRARLLERMRTPPHGGSAADYVAWALEVAGVTRAWVYPLEGGPGTVTVRFVRDNDASIIPDAGEVTAVQAHIDQVSPVTAVVTVAAPTASPIAYTISITPDTAATRAAVEAELVDLLRRDAAPGGAILRSQIDVAIGVAEGVRDFTVTVPAADVTHTAGQIATQGVITWV